MNFGVFCLITLGILLIVLGLSAIVSAPTHATEGIILALFGGGLAGSGVRLARRR